MEKAATPTPQERAMARKLAVSSRDRTRKTGFARCPTANYLITIIREEFREACTTGDTGFRAAKSRWTVNDRRKRIHSNGDVHSKYATKLVCFRLALSTGAFVKFSLPQQ